MLKNSMHAGKVEAGCDEAGRGCLAGPVCAAAVILPQNFSHPFLNDSKQLSKKKRNILRAIIEEEAVSYGVCMVEKDEIDKINILNASIVGMHRAIDKLNTRPEVIIVDGNRFKPYPFIPHVTVVKGDSKFMNIAAASILAKTYRDDLIEGLHLDFPVYNWIKNKGYPTIEHRLAIAEHGICEHHRTSFKVSLPSR